MDEPSPAQVDPTESWYWFEKGKTKAGSGADQHQPIGQSGRQRRLRIIWAGADVGGLFAINVGSFANNLGPGPPLFALNLGWKSRCLWVRARMFVGRYTYAAVNGPMGPTERSSVF